MAMDPIGRPSPAPADAQRVETTQRPYGHGDGQNNPEVSANTQATDVLALSPEALESVRPEGVPGGTLSRSQLELIGQRLASGAYDSTVVLDLIGPELAKEVSMPIAWGGLG